MHPITSLSDADLLASLAGVIASGRRLLGRLLRFLGEVEDRRLHLTQGYSSMFDFCTTGLRMSEGEAYRRIAAARLGRRFPGVLELVESGAVHLSALVLLRDHLTEENHAELLEAVSGRSKREVEKLLAARFPKPDVPSTLRRLPRRAPSAPAVEPKPPTEATAPPSEVAVDDARPGTSRGLSLEKVSRASSSKSARQPAGAARAGGRVEPLSAVRYKVQLTASEALKEKLQRVRDLLRHAVPSGDLAEVVERALDALLERLEHHKPSKRVRRDGAQLTAHDTARIATTTATGQDELPGGPTVTITAEPPDAQRDKDGASVVGRPQEPEVRGPLALGRQGMSSRVERPRLIHFPEAVAHRSRKELLRNDPGMRDLFTPPFDEHVGGFGEAGAPRERRDEAGR